MKALIKKVVTGQDLTFDEAKDAMSKMLGGGATHAQIASFLTALMIKGETLDEIVGCATVMREKADRVSPKGRPNYVDLVGTGGDGTFTFNISTTAAFVAAGAGCSIAKHGNRSISSKSGAIDVLEKLGINVMLEASQVEKCIEENGIGFMFAQIMHKSMKDVGIVRRELGIRTIFNILGPLSNPSWAEGMVVGVFSNELVDPFSKAMKIMGVKNALIMHSADGMDELSTSSDTLVAEIKDGEITTYTITPEQFGFKRADISDLKGGDADYNKNITLSILKGEEKGPKRDIVLLNAAGTLYVGKAASSIQEGIKLAAESIDSGAALKTLEAVKEFTNRV
ncbi:MAG: anthranilate phosphoribosyltransferase [Clostridiales bacterium]|nr:anthranilate phosphoribosyltransferase [Clostridiales bacterium]